MREKKKEGSLGLMAAKKGTDPLGGLEEDEDSCLKTGPASRES